MTKLTLKQMILNEIDNAGRGYSEELANVSGTYSNGSNLKKVLQNEEKEFDQLQGLLKIVEHIWGDESLFLIVDYSKIVDPNKKTARNLLEYLSQNRKFDDLIELINKMDNCKNRESQEYAKLYRMLYKYEKASNKEMSLLLAEIGEINVSVPELKVFKKMLKNYCYSQMNSYHIVKIISKEIELELELIESNFIKEMYVIRTNQIMSYTHLRVCNNPELAREYANSIIESNMATKPFKAHAYFIIGYSYFFSSYDNTIKYLNKSKEIYDQLGRISDVEDLTEKIELASVYWDKFNENNCNYIKNEIFLMIKKGNDATEYLLNNNDKMDLEFHLFLEGVNQTSDKKLMRSLTKYVKKNDIFLANFAKIQLLKNGYDDVELINELMGDDVI